MFHGCERFFRPGYHANLVASWLPACDGLVERLRSEAKVADIGCGHGASTLIMAAEYPTARFHGFDYHDASIGAARKTAADDRFEDNLNPVGRAHYNFSSLLCVPNALSQQPAVCGAALGAQAGEPAIRRVVTEAGFNRFRRVAETPFNHVYEARP